MGPEPVDETIEATLHDKKAVFERVPVSDLPTRVAKLIEQLVLANKKCVIIVQ